MTFYTLHRRSELRSVFAARLLASMRASFARFAKSSSEPLPAPASHELGSLQTFAMMLRN